MQTFLPFTSFLKSALALDNRRLNKQIQEADILLDLIYNGGQGGWIHHPAYRMWAQYGPALMEYRNTCLAVWRMRGGQHQAVLYTYPPPVYPAFLGDARLLISHRSNLVRKLPEHYGKFGWKDYGVDGYYWPVKLKTASAQRVKQWWMDRVHPDQPV